jgi:hypothetical protein
MADSRYPAFVLVPLQAEVHFSKALPSARNFLDSSRSNDCCSVMSNHCVSFGVGSQSEETLSYPPLFNDGCESQEVPDNRGMFGASGWLQRIVRRTNAVIDDGTIVLCSPEQPYLFCSGPMRFIIRKEEARSITQARLPGPLRGGRASADVTPLVEYPLQTLC